MLKIEKLKVSGFKSFGDRTEVDFPTGITAVVGPNGCGKSNIGDALNWVLGEQSARQLRGRQMTDVIFSGSRDRKPVGLAEVSIQFGGANGLSHSDQGRVVVTRRLFRSGDSEYLINGNRTRLRDIQEMLRQAKVGARTYATIEQGKIDQVLNSKPKERRALIEDAAGVSGYKHKRRLAELKLEATQANLLRVNDIVQEVTRQINSLKRQAAKARRYRELREELRRKESVRFGRRARELDDRLGELRQREAEAREAEARAAEELGRLETGLRQQREALDLAAAAFREGSERLHQLELAADRDDARIAAARERATEAAELERRQAGEAQRLATRLEEAGRRRDEQRAVAATGRERLSRLEAELRALQAQAAELEARHRQAREAVEHVRRRQFDSMSEAAELRNATRSSEQALARARIQRQRLVTEQEMASRDWTRTREETAELEQRAGQRRTDADASRAEQERGEQALREARERQTADGERLAAAREREHSALARLRTLEDLATRFAGVSDGVKNLLASAGRQGIRVRGVVADYVEAGREIEGAAESYLQPLLPAVIVEADEDARRAAALLRQEEAGRTWLISRGQPAGAVAVGGPAGQTAPPEIAGDPRVLGRLRDKLDLKTSANGVVADRIGDAVLVRDLEAALELHRAWPAADYLTPDGDVVYASGVICTGGRRTGDHGLLAHQRRLREARVAAEEAASEAASLRRHAEQLHDEVRRLEHEVAARRDAAETAERAAVELELQVRLSREESERTGRRSELLAEELAAAAEEIERLGEEGSGLAERLQRVEHDHGELEQELGRQVELATETEERLRAMGEQVAELRAEVARHGQRQESAEQEAARLDSETAELDQRVVALRAEIEAARQRAKESAAQAERSEASLARHRGEHDGLAGELRAAEEEIARLQRQLAEHEQGLTEVRASQEQRAATSRQAELERTQAESERRHLDDLCSQELGMSAGEAATALAEQEAEAGEAGRIDLEALEQRIVEIRERIERIGPVNMTAIEEFSELEERDRFLTAQREDLEHSMASLRETIRRLNRQSRERFADAFEKVRANFQEIFQLLFNGGRGDLRLEEEEDILEAGIEILAQPPGKRLAGIHLLSGGEKALSAVALLFAIFRYQPSPFCLLDEVDAALDDANVVRFARMVREYAANTQFVIITHNKLSMEAADLLYGVTMEEPGVSKVVSLQLQ